MIRKFDVFTRVCERFKNDLDLQVVRKFYVFRQ